MYTGTNVSMTDHLRPTPACFLCGVRQTQKLRAWETTLKRTGKWVGEMQRGSVRHSGENATILPVQDMFGGAGKLLYLSLLGGALL